MRKIKKAIFTCFIIYAFCMIIVDCLFSMISIGIQTDVKTLVLEKEIPLIVCMIALQYSLYSIWKSKD